MTQGIVSTNNDTQIVTLPTEAQFPEGVKEVNIRVNGEERILTPVESSWDNFFLAEDGVSEDFMDEHSVKNEESNS